MDEQSLEERFRAEFEALVTGGHAPLQVVMTPLEAWAVLCNIQLASRHPLNNRTVARTAIAVAKRIQAQVAPTGALSEVASKGWDKTFDVDR
jgi:hypothetical protein